MFTVPIWRMRLKLPSGVYYHPRAHENAPLPPKVPRLGLYERELSKAVRMYGLKGDWHRN